MSPKIQGGLVELENSFQSFIDSWNRDIKVEGDAVSDSLTSTLGLNFKSCQRFWKSRNLEQNAFHDVIGYFDDEDSSQLPPEMGRSKIYDAYSSSKRTLAAVSEGVSEGMFYNDDFFNRVTGRSTFVELE